MTNTCYTDMLRCILFHKKPTRETVSSLSLWDLYDFFELHKLLSLGLEIAQYWQIKTPDEQELITFWKNKVAGSVVLEYQKLALVKQLQELALEKNIPLLFFKGYALACLYPDFTKRNSSDTDIYVSPSYKEKMIALLHSLSYEQVNEPNADQVLTFLYKKEEITIHKMELHFSLYEDLSPRQIDVLDKIRLFSPDLSTRIFICGFSIQTPDHQQHLIYQFVHMIKHFCEQGFPARYLLDTSLFIREYHTLIDWSYVEDIMEQLGFMTFYINFLSILIRDFDVPNYILPKVLPSKNLHLTDLLSDIYSFGMRSREEKLAHYFFCFSQYLRKNLCPLQTPVTYDGTCVPFSLVPPKYQYNEILQKRIQLLEDLQLL